MKDDNYWENLSDQLLSAGQAYFTGQQNNATTLTLAKINSDTIVTVVKWGAIALGIALVLKAIFKKLF